MWDPQRPALAGRHVVRRRAPRPRRRAVADVATIGALAGRVLDAAGGEPFSFVGLSLGGAIGMRLALDHPERVERLVLACTSARFGEPAQWHERAAVGAQPRGSRRSPTPCSSGWFTPGSPTSTPTARMLPVDRPARATRAAARRSRGWTAATRSSASTRPTLVVAGADDPATPPAVVEALAARIPGARFAVLADAAHLANVERPDDFNRLLEEHLR